MKFNLKSGFMFWVGLFGLISILFFRVYFSPQYYYGFSLFKPFFYIAFLVLVFFSFSWFFYQSKFLKNNITFYISFLILIYIVFHVLFLSEFLDVHPYIYAHQTAFLETPFNPNILGAIIFLIFNSIFPLAISRILNFSTVKKIVILAAYFNVFIALTQWLFFLTGTKFLIGVHTVGIGGSDGLIYFRANGMFTNPFPYVVFLIVTSWLSMLNLSDRITFQPNLHTYFLSVSALLANSKTAIVLIFLFWGWLILFNGSLKRKVISIFFIFIVSCLAFYFIVLYDLLEVFRIFDASQYEDQSRLGRMLEAIPAIMSSPIIGYGYSIQFYTDNIITYLLLSGGLIHLLLWLSFAISPLINIYMVRSKNNKFCINGFGLYGYFLVIIIVQVIQSSITSSYYSIPNWFIIILISNYIVNYHKRCFK
ncbi:hypothetical protein N6C01_003084 [Vibrio metschnikovii]|nr:hypothetical protein [Vibrio metschnikovii]